MRSKAIHVPSSPVTHSNLDYEERFLYCLRDMEARHFWYRGRYRFLIHAVRQTIGEGDQSGLDAVDIGGGCGGWMAFLHRKAPALFKTLVLADSSLRALELAAPVVDGIATRHQVDVLALEWRDRWDVVFFFDVLKHI